MRVVESADLLAIASEVLNCGTTALLETTDLDALEQVVMAARGEDLAVSAAALLGGLVRRRPFVRSNRRIAVLGTVHLALLNRCDLDLRPVGELDELLDAVAAGAVDDKELAGRLSVRLRRRNSRQEAGMFERFTESARRAVNLAQEEARMLGHGYIGTEHVLLGLLREGENVAARVLSEFGITVRSASDAVLEIVGEGTYAPRSHIPFTPRSKKLLELSLREALHLGHDYIGTEHILLGIVREGEGVAAQILQKFGADLKLVRAKVIEALSDGVADGGADVRPPELEALLDENERLRAEVARLRALLRDHGIDPDT